MRIKKLALNFSFRIGANLLSKLLGLITLPLITRALGPESYGNYNIAMVVVQYTSLPIALLGLRSYGIREIAAKRKKQEYANEILSQQFTIALVAIVFSLIISYIIFHSETLLFTAIVIGYIIVFSRAFDLEFFFVSQKDLVFPTIAKILGQVFYVLGVVLLIKGPNDFVILILLASISPVIADIIQLNKFNKRYSKLKVKVSLTNVLLTFKKTWRLGISQNIEGLIGTVPQIFIPIIMGSYAMGIYSGGYKVYSIFMLFYVTFFYALAPYLVQLNDFDLIKRKRYHLLIFLLLLVSGSLSGIILYIFGERFVLILLGKSFGDSIFIFKAISIILIPLTPVFMLLGNILIYSGHEKYYLNALIIQVISISLLTPFLIKVFGLIGAVYGLGISMLLATFVLFWYYLRSLQLEKN